MRKIPITPGHLTGEILEAAHRGYLEGTDLVAWADALLTAGLDTDSIIQTISDPGMHWERVRPLFSSICREVGLSDDILAELAALKQAVMIEEYRQGYRQAAELLWRFDDLRKRAGFPEMIELRILEDNADRTNDSGFYSSSRKWHGQELEGLARRHLENAGIYRIERHSPGAT